MRLSRRAHERFWRPRRVRAGLAQLLFALAGLALGLLLPQITAWPDVDSHQVTNTLIGLGFGVLGLVTLIFSLLFGVVQWAFSSLSPRLNVFRDDPVVWRTFGLAVGVFVYSITAALVIGDSPKVSVIVPIAEVAAVLASVVMIRVLQLRAFSSIQLAPTLSAIATRGRRVLDDMYSRSEAAGSTLAAPLPPLRRTVTWPHRPTTLQQLDVARLAAAAGSGVIVLRVSIGDTLQEGGVVADLHGGDVTDTAVLGALVTAQERTFNQDPMFAFRLLADIGLRAMSTAINDPATAVDVLNTTESLLAALASRDLDVARVTDDAGVVRVVLAVPSWDDYLRLTLDDFIEAASRLPMVLLRTRALLSDLLAAAPPERQPSLTWRLHRVEELAAGNFPAIWRDATTSQQDNAR
jgi:uncharacterized membrane protein